MFRFLIALIILVTLEFISIVQIPHALNFEPGFKFEGTVVSSTVLEYKMTVVREDCSRLLQLI